MIAAPAILLLGCTDDDGGLEPGVNERPVLNITAPENGSRFTEGQPVPLRATAFNTEDGVLEGESVVGTSDKNGAIGTGTQMSPLLSASEHRITATAIDSEFAEGTGTISIGVDPIQPPPPTASIEQPLAAATFQLGTPVEFIGTATFPGVTKFEPSAFVWTSDVDGQIGVGPQVTDDALSLGAHLIMLTVTVLPATATASVPIEIVP